MAKLHAILLEFTLECLDELIIHYNLNVHKEITVYGFTVILENTTDFLSLSYSNIHPYDYPFVFDVRYCKQSFFDKNKILYRTDTKEITPLWRFDKNLNTTISSSLKKDMPMIDECCKKAVSMYAYFAKMSDEEYLMAHRGFSQG